MTTHAAAEELRLPRRAVQLPLELRIPAGFRADDPTTYPEVEGRIEYVEGRLWYMPPTRDIQQDVVPSVVHALMSWALGLPLGPDGHPPFIVSSNEAGMILGGEVRGADAAVWRHADAAQRTGGYRRTPPVLAVEVAGVEDDEDTLRAKAAWYVAHGVAVVWIVLPPRREVLVVSASFESRHGASAHLPPHGELPALCPAVDRIFAQLG